MLHTWKIKIQGNSMEGLFPDGKELRVKVNSDFIADELEIGRIVILKKHSLIIHRIVGKFWGQNQFYFWEKGDNDCYPKLCIKENILGIVTGIEDYPDFRVKHHPSLWRQKNTELLKFYKIANKIYVLIMGGNVGMGTNVEMGTNVGIGENVRTGKNVGTGGNVGMGTNVGMGENVEKGANVVTGTDVGMGGNAGIGGNMGKGANVGMGGNVGMGRNMNQRHGLIEKLRRKGFWSLFYLICSLLDLKGK